MSHVGKNIKKIRTVKKLSQAAFAELFNLARPSVGAYEEGRSEPKIDTLLQMSQHFGLSLDQLLAKELTVNELYGFDIFKKDYKKEDALIKVAAPPTDEEQVPAVRFVSATHVQAYIASHREPDFLKSLPPAALLAGETKGLSRAFEVANADMQYQQHGLHPGDILICYQVELREIECLHVGEIYVLVLQNRLLVRRLVKNDQQYLTLQADNPSYKSEKIEVQDIQELWQAKGVYSTDLKAPAMLEERVLQLESKVKMLHGQLQSLTRES